MSFGAPSPRRASALFALSLCAGCAASGSSGDAAIDAATPDQAASSGCSKDTDCKGDRVCVKGQCVAPQVSDAGTACAKDTDCKGNRICVAGGCVDPPLPDGATPPDLAPIPDLVAAGDRTGFPDLLPPDLVSPL